jgi:putative transposase
MVDIASNRNYVYQTAYHVVWCPKYRRDVLTGLAAEEIAVMLDVMCAERGWPLISKEIQPDHIHLFVSIPPAIAVADAVKILIKILKGTTAHKLFQRHPWLNSRLWGEISSRPPTMSAHLATSAPKRSSAISNDPNTSPGSDNPCCALPQSQFA